jgi:cell division protein FtsQ
VPIVVAGVLVVGLAAWLLLGTSVLGVSQIVVTGTRIASPDQVRVASGVAIGSPMLALDTSAVAARVRSLPSVADAHVRRSFPHTLVITVTERTPAGVFAEPGGFGVLSADGVVFEQMPSPPPGIALIRVTSPGPDDPATLAALRVAAALTPRLRVLLREVDAPSPTTISLALTDGRTVIWGDASQSEFKASVATTLLDHAAHTIDVSVPDVASVY